MRSFHCLVSINVNKRALAHRLTRLSSQNIVTGAELFSPIEACEEEQGSVVHPRDRRDDEHNEERRKKIKPERLFGVIWSSE